MVIRRPDRKGWHKDLPQILKSILQWNRAIVANSGPKIQAPPMNPYPSILYVSSIYVGLLCGPRTCSTLGPGGSVPLNAPITTPLQWNDLLRSCDGMSYCCLWWTFGQSPWTSYLCRWRHYNFNSYKNHGLHLYSFANLLQQSTYISKWGDDNIFSNFDVFWCSLLLYVGQRWLIVEVHLQVKWLFLHFSCTKTCILAEIWMLISLRL